MILGDTFFHAFHERFNRKTTKKAYFCTYRLQPNIIYSHLVMKVIVDNKIPYISPAIEQLANEVVYVEGNLFTPELVRNADALIIRTRTHCNRELLEGSNVKFIATATIGFDHIDTAYCKEKGITWTNAPGCNSGSVAQYIESALLLLEKEKGLELSKMTLGIVGVGNVGSKVETVARKLGLKVLLNDLPRQEKEGETAFSCLQQLAKECDVITFHTPLYNEGAYKTYHLAGADFFQSLKKSPIIINTSRGEVVDTNALLHAMNQGIVSEAIIDVWENEPHINLELMNRAFIATPHIAGYSADGKANATRMSLDALCKFFNLKGTYQINPPAPENKIMVANTYSEAILKIYNPQRDSMTLKANPEDFEKQRGHYPFRREPDAYRIETTSSIIRG